MTEEKAIWIRDPLAILAEGAGGGLVVRGPEILELVPAGRKPKTKVTETFDAGRHVVLPGLINTHHHFYQTLTRAHPAALDKPLFPWLAALYPVWQGLDPESLRLATRLALVELLLSGCTTAADHHYVFPAGLEDAIDIQVGEAKALGLRVTLTRGSMNLSQNDGGLPPESVVQEEAVILADSERLLARFHDPGPGSFLQIALAPCSPFSVSPELMRESAALAARYGARLHTHLAETESETEFCLESFGCRPLDHLEAVDWLGPQTWLAHGIHFEPAEIARLGAAGVGICHCPTSNMTLGSGFCRTLDLEAAGAPLGLGVDGSASQDASNLMEEARHALLLNRLTYGPERVSHRDVLRWATEGSARCLGRTDIGRIAVGCQADLALFTLDDLRFSGAGDPLAALILCGAQAADRVMVGGVWLVEEGMPLGLDLAALRREHGQAAAGFAV